MTRDEIIDGLLRREGGEVNNIHDRGGATNFGITQKSWEAFRAQFPKAGYPTHVFDITKAHAREFYGAMYVQPLWWIENDALRELVIDSAVNHGATRAVRWLQSAAGVQPDGIIGPKTQDAVLADFHETPLGASAHYRNLYARILKTRILFYADIIARDPSQATFARGWFKRACEFIF